MKLSRAVKPISYIKTHAAEIINHFSCQPQTIIITHNGEAKAVMQDVKTYEAMQESVALLKILALSAKSVEQNKVKSVKEAFTDIRQAIKSYDER